MSDELYTPEKKMRRSATFSPDRKRRFDLVRDWQDEGGPDRTALFAGLNPSKADENDDDPTVRKTVGFGKRWGFGRIVLVNLLSIVSTHPWDLPFWCGIDMENRAIIQHWMGEADIVVAAWGSQPGAVRRKIALPELIYLFRQIAPVTLYCIGTTKCGDPIHPSRTAYTTGPEI